MASGIRALGDDGLGRGAHRVLQAAALPRSLRSRCPTSATSPSRLRDAEVVDRTGVDAPKLVELHRVSVTNILMAAGTILGVYLLIGELTEVDFADIVRRRLGVDPGRGPLLPATPDRRRHGHARLGDHPLPLWPVVGVQFANNFTGFVGRHRRHAALVVRFFQRQGMAPAVAVSSGRDRRPLGASCCQAIFVRRLAVTWSAQLRHRAARSSGSAEASCSSSSAPRLARSISGVVLVGASAPPQGRQAGRAPAALGVGEPARRC